MKFPDFARVGEGSALRHCGNGKYYRDAGDWDIQATWTGQTLLCSTRTGPLKHLLGKQVHAITEAVWKRDNEGYVPKRFRRKTTKKEKAE